MKIILILNYGSLIFYELIRVFLATQQSLKSLLTKNYKKDSYDRGTCSVGDLFLYVLVHTNIMSL